MVTTISKWGNSLAVRIPQQFAKDIDLAEGTEIEFSIVDGALVIKPQQHKRYSLTELVEQITPDNLHDEIDDGDAVGNEAW